MWLSRALALLLPPSHTCTSTRGDVEVYFRHSFTERVSPHTVTLKGFLNPKSLSIRRAATANANTQLCVFFVVVVPLGKPFQDYYY